jgi:hypothetical protein
MQRNRPSAFRVGFLLVKAEQDEDLRTPADGAPASFRRSRVYLTHRFSQLPVKPLIGGERGGGSVGRKFDHPATDTLVEARL